MTNRTRVYIDGAIKGLAARLKALELVDLKRSGFEIDEKFHTITFPKGDPRSLIGLLRGLWPSSLKPLISYCAVPYTWHFGTPVVNWKFLQGGKTLSWFELTTAPVEEKK